MALAIWKTLKEIEHDYNISANTLRGHINSNKVPKYHIKKIAKTWLINENYIIKNYEKRDKIE